MGIEAIVFFVPVGSKVYYFNVDFADSNANKWNTLNGYYTAPDKINYSIIDLNANNGMGAVVSKNNLLFSVSAYKIFANGGFTPIKHANGTDWWILKNATWDGDVPKYYIWLLSETGIVQYPTIVLPKLDTCIKPPLSNEGCLDNHKFGDAIVFSNNGKNMLYTQPFTFCIANFNRCTGALTGNKQIINTPRLWKFYSTNQLDSFIIEFNHDSAYADRGITGTVFSPNDKYVYVVKQLSIWQYEWQEPDSSKAWVLLHAGVDTTTWLEGYPYANPILGPDGKIYIGIAGCCNPKNRWQVIENPNVKGLGCNLTLQGIKGNTVVSRMGLQGTPIIPNYNLGQDSSLCWPLSTKPPNNTNMVQVYPNPANTILHIKMEIPAELQMVDIVGKKVLQQPLLGNMVDNLVNIAGLKSGVYIYAIKNKVGIMQNGKLVVE